MSDIKFSVIIPVYNSEEYIARCINSLISQTYENVEIITIDDGSTDSSLKILKELAQNNSRIKVLSQSNSGPSAARNKGLQIASGDYLSFVDSDDWMELSSYEQLYNEIVANDKPDIVMFNALRDDIVRNKPFLKNGLYTKRQIEEQVYPRTIESLDASHGGAIRASVCLRVFKYDSIKSQILFKEELTNNEDLVFCFEAILKSQTFLYLGDHYLYHNCMTPGSASRGYMKDAFSKVKPLFHILSNIDLGYESYDFSNQIKGRANRLLIFCLENEFHRDCKKSFLQKYKYVKRIVQDRELKKYLNHYTPKREKAKRLYHFLYKNQQILLLLLFAQYRVQKQ